MQTQTLTILAQPLPKRGPLTDEGFVGDLDRAVRHRDESRVRQDPQDVIDLDRPDWVVRGHEL